MGLAYEMLNNLEQAQEHYEKVAAHETHVHTFITAVLVTFCKRLSKEPRVRS